MKRLFAAVKIIPDKDFLDQLNGLKRELAHERIKWVEDHNIHITLKFFGDTGEKKIPLIRDIFTGISKKQAVFGFYLRSLGIFGSRYDPRVIWTGIEPYDHFVDLMKEIRSELKTIGYEPDRQNLVPHLTLGRIREIKDRKLFQQVIDKFGSISSRELTAGEFILFESILRKEGPVYIALHSFPFQK